ncbi:MAG: VWA domain-containing protein [Planctomycetota bacterium]|nr:MAG: VWA domain-containing protein [Planctomycetota bacterium]
MHKEAGYLICYCLLVFSFLFGGSKDLNRWISQFQQGGLEQKKIAISEIAKIGNPKGFEFIYKEVLRSASPSTISLRVHSVEALAKTKNPYAFYYIYKSFTMANMTFWPKFKERMYPYLNKKILVKLLKTLSRESASDWEEGKAFFVTNLGNKKVKKAARIVAGLLLNDTSPKVRQAAAFTLLDLMGKKSATYLGRALRDKDPKVRKAVLLSLGEIKTSGAYRAISHALQDKETENVLLAIQFLSQSNQSKYARKILALLNHKNRDIRKEALKGLRHLLKDRAKSYFIRACQDNDWQIRLAAFYHLKEFGQDPAFVKIYKRGLRDQYPQIQSISVWGLYHIGSNNAIEELITALGFLQDAPLKDAYRALQKLTGQKLALNQDAWREWWSNHKQGFRPKRDIETPYTPPGERESGSGQMGKTVLRKKPMFFGSTIESFHVGFVVDFSTSMNAMMDTIEEGEREGTRERKHKVVQRERIEVAKRELIRAVAALDPKATFNIMLFGSSYVAWKPKAVVASKENKDSAIQFVRHHTFMGATNLYDPLEKMILDKDIDTIYVLSDGAPNQGKYSSPPDILKAVKKLNRNRKVRIFTIGIGVISYTEDFLRDLAEQNGGKFIKK